MRDRLLDLRPDPGFLEDGRNWIWLLLAIGAIVGLVVYFIKRKKR